LILKKIAICAAALVAAAIASQLAQAAGKSGPTPPPPAATHGKSANAPGHNKPAGDKSAEDVAPGEKKSKDKK
jgi:hypothetical protein